MRVRAQDSSGDMTFGQSAQNFLVDSPAAVAQIVETTLRLVLGEWYQDLSQGVPYLQGVVGTHSKATADQVLISQITAVDNVTSLTDWDSVIDPVTRKYTSISGKLFTAFGETQLQIENLGNI